MNVVEIVNQLEHGKKIKRKGWENIALISYRNYEFIYDLYIYDLVLKYDVFPLIKYQFNVTDILADDWEVVE